MTNFIQIIRTLLCLYFHFKKVFLSKATAAPSIGDNNLLNDEFHSNRSDTTMFKFSFSKSFLSKATAAPSIGDNKLDYIDETKRFTEQ